MRIEIGVWKNGSVLVSLVYRNGAMSQTCYANMRHAIVSIGDWLPFTAVPVRVFFDN
jgi:hypothetical protein